LPAQEAAAICDGLGTCCRSQGFTFDDAACRSVWQVDITNFAPTSTAAKYDANAAGECVAAERSYYAGCGVAGTVNLGACSRVYIGTIAEGGACADDEECIDPAGGDGYCNTAGGGGVCATKFPAAHGTLGQGCSGSCARESCGTVLSGPNVDCFRTDGLYCSSANTCQQLAEVGGPCEPAPDDSCVSTAYCDSTTNLCVARNAVGASCPGWGTCIDTAFCGASGVCEAKKANGQPCASDVECWAYCDNASSDHGGVRVCRGDLGNLASVDRCTVYYGAY
jgi:hypothetical protein